MRQAALAGIAAFFLTFLVPVFLPAPELEKPEPMVLIIEEPELSASVQEEIRMIRLSAGGTITEIPLEEYLVGVVLAEMPASFEKEALKAQAVAARTFTLRQCEGNRHADYDICADPGCCQAWTDCTSMENKLGAAWENCRRKGEEAVAETAGQVMTWQGQLIDAVYFSCSGGRTEDAQAVWGSEVPYLHAVDSPGEEAAARFESEVSVPQDELRSRLQKENPQCSWAERPVQWFGEVRETPGSGVAEMEIGGCSFKGTDLRRIFGLNSTRFSVSVGEHDITFHVLGNGHRVGMSQYGANAMAKEGKNYAEILHYYYKDTELAK